MRKLISFIHSTFNGVVTGNPSDDKTNFMAWTQPSILEESSEDLLHTFDTVDTILLGRNTYEDLMRKWPSVKEWPGVNDVALRLGEKVNNAAKFVVTSKNEMELTWGKFAEPKQVTGNIEQAIRNLKSSDGGDIIIFGSPTLVRSLTDANLIDEYQILVHPVVVNVGEHLFDNLKERKDFRLIDTRTYDNGALLIKYVLT
jgi:dihydrofolate reductase